VSMLVTIVDGPDPEAGFTHAWYAIALGMVLAALAALRLSSVTAAKATESVAAVA
jgi:hypothetical protein